MDFTHLRDSDFFRILIASILREGKVYWNLLYGYLLLIEFYYLPEISPQEIDRKNVDNNLNLRSKSILKNNKDYFFFLSTFMHFYF